MPIFSPQRAALRAVRPGCRSAARGVIIVLAGVLVCQSLLAQPPARENEVKATLLFNFCHFVQWPDTAFPATSTPFVIAILGEDPFGRFLDSLVVNERSHGRPIEVRRFSRLEEITGVQILYVSRSEQARARSVVAALRGNAVLTVGEDTEPAFTQAGGLVGFFIEGGNIKIRINLDETRESGLNISSKLLRLAKLMPSHPHASP